VVLILRAHYTSDVKRGQNLEAVTNFLLILQNDANFSPYQPRLATNKINKRGVVCVISVV